MAEMLKKKERQRIKKSGSGKDVKRERKVWIQK